MERQPGLLGLALDQLAADPVAAAAPALREGGQEPGRLQLSGRAQLVEQEGAVLAAAPGDQDGLGHSFLPRTSSQRKNGPPRSAVSTPTGSSAGAMTVRAATSQIARKAPPPSRQAGARKRWSCPTQRRSMCGTISPTKPIGPATATSAPIISEETPSTRRRRRTRSTPRLAASSSPVRRRFRSQRSASSTAAPPSTQGAAHITSP